MDSAESLIVDGTHLKCSACGPDSKLDLNVQQSQVWNATVVAQWDSSCFVIERMWVRISKGVELVLPYYLFSALC